MSTKKTYDFTPDYAVAPGESLREEIEYLDMTQVEFAKRMELTPQSLSRILSGDQPITYETAQKLEYVTGIVSQYWNNLEAKYREQLQLKALQQQETQFKAFIKLFPIKTLVERAYIEKREKPTEQGIELLKFFKIGSLQSFDNYASSMKAAARSSSAFSTSTHAAVTYINMGLHEADKLSVKGYEENNFKDVLAQTRKMIKDPPKNWDKKLQELFASAGVALVFIPSFTGIRFSGLSKWITASKAMIIMNIRGKREDKFWFSLFHEAAHILKHKKKQIYIAESSSKESEEIEADKFAADFLIPAKYNERIKQASDRDQIIEIAHELDISPGVVAGRYQFLTNNWDHYTDLISKMSWKDEDA